MHLVSYDRRSAVRKQPWRNYRGKLDGRIKHQTMYMTLSLPCFELSAGYYTVDCFWPLQFCFDDLETWLWNSH